jgi:hypothetical protein
MEDMELKIDWLGGNCPVQAEGTVGNKKFYFRSRGARWSMNIGGEDLITNPEWRYEEPYGETFEAGWITEVEARLFIEKAVRKYRKDMIL